LNKCITRIQALLPQACLLCGADGGGGQLCAPCEAELPRLPEKRCEVCAVPLPSGAVCGACLDRPPRFARVVAPFSYRFPLTALLHAYKYGGRLAHARVLGAALAAVVMPDAEVIVPMPLAPRRLAERGFNQALEIARFVAGATGLPLLPRACRKIVETPPQASLPWKERAGNVRRAFVCDADLREKRVAVIDDVLTTGATLNELARVLRRAGATEVTGWVVARTLPR
jgi:ComF family protein